MQRLSNLQLQQVLHNTSSTTSIFPPILVCPGSPVAKEEDSAEVDANYTTLPGSETPPARARMHYRVKRIKAPDGQAGSNSGWLRARSGMAQQQQQLPTPQLHDPKVDAQCGHCGHEPFKDVATLRRHVAAAHTRPFPCAFAFAGCTSRFGSKNEWKRHIASNHLGLYYYRCSSCSQDTTNGKGNVFNRKDSFTQHLRRKHIPVYIHKAMQKRDIKVETEWGDYVTHMQKTCCIVRRLPPQRSACPKVNCSQLFEGRDAWNEWAEHVGQHMENGEGDLLSVDGLLVSWALDQKIIMPTEDGGYRLYNPITSSSSGGSGIYQTSAKHLSLKTWGPSSLKKTTAVTARRKSSSMAATSATAKAKSNATIDKTASISMTLGRRDTYTIFLPPPTPLRVSLGVLTLPFFSLSRPAVSSNESVVLPPLKNGGLVVPNPQRIPTLQPDSQGRVQHVADRRSTSLGSVLNSFTGFSTASGRITGQS